MMPEPKNYDDMEMMPDRKWWSHSCPVSTIPRDISRYFFEIKNRFGIDVANLVLFARKEWGPRAARVLATKLLEFQDFKEIMSFLEKKAAMFDTKSRSTIVSLIYRFKYAYHFDKLLELLKREDENKCQGLRSRAVTIFHQLAREGLFYNPECIIECAKHDLGCVKTIPRKCAPVKNALKKYL